MFAPAIVAAQTPEAEEDTAASRINAIAGVDPVAEAETSFMATGISLTAPMSLQFNVEVYSSESDADLIMETVRTHYIDIMTEFAEEESENPPKVEEASSPKIGDDQYAIVMEIEFEQFSAIYGVVILRSGQLIVVGVAGGLGGNMFEALEPVLAQIEATWIETAMDDAVDPLELLPSLSDMPPGFVIDDDE